MSRSLHGSSVNEVSVTDVGEKCLVQKHNKPKQSINNVRSRWSGLDVQSLAFGQYDNVNKAIRYNIGK